MDFARSGSARSLETHRPLRLALAVLLLVPAGALAQSWSPPIPAGCPDAPNDAAERRTLAGEFFQKGLERDEAGDFATAASYYACCFHIAEHPNTLYNLALSAEKAGDVRTAQRALERYITEAPGALNLEEAAALLAAVSRRVAELPPEAAPTTLPPVSSAPPGPSVGRPPVPEFPGPPAVVTPFVPPPDEGPSAMAIAGWSLLGGGAAIAIVGGVAFGVLAGQETDAVEGSAPGTSWSDIAPHLGLHDDYQAAEIAMLAVGGAVLAAGVVLLILDATDESSDAEAAVVPVVGDESVGFALAGRF
jgi:hypothetical protein